MSMCCRGLFSLQKKVGKTILNNMIVVQNPLYMHHSVYSIFTFLGDLSRTSPPSLPYSLVTITWIFGACQNKKTHSLWKSSTCSGRCKVSKIRPTGSSALAKSLFEGSQKARKIVNILTEVLFFESVTRRKQLPC